MRYKLGTRQMTASLGKYPAVPIVKARQKAQEARELAAEGSDVTQARKNARTLAAVVSGHTFKVVAAEWVTDTARDQAWSERHKEKVVQSIRKHLSNLNDIPVTALTALICDPELRKVEADAPEIARKVYQRLRSILDYAHGRGMILSNPLPATRRRPRGAVRHFPAELSATAVGEILRNAERSKAVQCVGVHRAHVLCAFTAQRVGEVVGAEWHEFDLDAATWAIPRSRMKRHNPALGAHVVPLPPGLLAQIREWLRIDQGTGFVCPSPTTGRHISREAAEKFYNRTLKLAGRHSPHSWRSVFSTWSREAGRDHGAIERQLDHTVGGSVQQAYDRADRLDIRRKIVEAHEQALIAARDGANVIDLAQRRA